jgi:ABC-type molybdate transport system substrate-binding protein
MVDLNNALSLLQEKLQLLLKQHAALEKEHQHLKQSLTQQTQLTKQLEAQLKEGQAQITATLLSKVALDPAEKEKWVKQIDQYLKEIDNCITNLNP